MTSSHLPVRVVVFASEQLFPALQFLLHAADHFGPALASIHIYCTRDERRSGAPARRLQRVVQRWGQMRGLGFDIHVTTGDMWPADVRSGLTDWFEAAPASRWLVNVTGGTKPMSAAATELTLATDLVSRRVIYQEIDGRWVELVVGAASLLDAVPLDAATDPVVPPADTLERLLTVSDLVATQFSDDHRITTQTLRALPVDEAVAAVMAVPWQWQTGLKRLAAPVTSTSTGDAFECFIGAGLQGCGLTITHSLKVTDSGPGGKLVREVDLVGCHRGRLVCIDIKLPGAEHHAKGTQLADVAELAQSLGGRGALAIAIRPGWAADGDMNRLAKALGVRLLTQADAPQLFTRLLGWIDPGLRPSTAALAAEQLLQAAQAQGNDVLSDGRHVPAKAESDGTILLRQDIERICERRGEPFGLVELDMGQYWLGIPKQRLSPQQLRGWDARLRRLERAHLYLALPEHPYLFRETKAWVMALLTLKPNLKVEDLRTVIREALT